MLCWTHKGCIFIIVNACLCNSGSLDTSLHELIIYKKKSDSTQS